ncbi:MAG: helix-turn-helix transcriptional regulator [Ilumatobacteraceae bacterium]
MTARHDHLQHDDQHDGSVAEVLPFPRKGRAHGADDDGSVDAPPDRLRDVIGGVLRDERRRQGRTLADVAEGACVSLAYLSEVERGRKEISSDLLSAVCHDLGLDLTELLQLGLRRLVPRHQSTPRIQMLAA